MLPSWHYSHHCSPVLFLQWFLDRMADDNWWPMQILIKCPNQIVRQVFSFFLFLLLYKQTNVQYTVLSYQCFCCVYDFFLFFLYLCFPRCSRGCVFMSYRGCDRFTPISTCSLEWKTGLSNSHLNPKIKTHPQRHVQGLFNFLSLLPPALTTWTAQWRTSAADRVSPALLKLFCPSWSMESNPTANTWPNTLPFSTSSPKWERKRSDWCSHSHFFFILTGHTLLKCVFVVQLAETLLRSWALRGD